MITNNKLNFSCFQDNSRINSVSGRDIKDLSNNWSSRQSRVYVEELNLTLPGLGWFIPPLVLCGWRLSVDKSQDCIWGLVKLRSAERGVPQHIVTRQRAVARKAEFFMGLPSQLITVFTISNVNFWSNDELSIHFVLS